MVAVGAISASAGNERTGDSASPKLVGSWMQTVDRGPALPPLKSLVSYSGGGTVVEIANGGATVRSPSHGTWKRIGNRRYGSTAVFFRYDAVSGAFIGTLKLRHELELAQDGSRSAAWPSASFATRTATCSQAATRARIS